MTAANDWSGRVGDTWAREWRRTERSFSHLAPHLARAILAVAPECGHFLDLGCGVGSTAAEIARARPTASVTGVDLAEPMIAIARERHAIDNLSFVTGDALSLDLPPAHLIFSRHGVMFFADPRAAFANLRRRAVPGTPLVFSCFGARGDNLWATELDHALASPAPARTIHAPGPFAFADQAYVADVLSRAGWQVVSAKQTNFNYIAGEGASDDAALDDAVSFFSRIGPAAGAIRAVTGEVRAVLLDRIRTKLARYVSSGRVAMPASAWIWTAHATGEPA